jgi:hypothetical protein
MIKKGDYLVIKPEWRDAGDEAFTWLRDPTNRAAELIFQR